MSSAHPAAWVKGGRSPFTLERESLRAQLRKGVMPQNVGTRQGWGGAPGGTESPGECLVGARPQGLSLCLGWSWAGWEGQGLSTSPLPCLGQWPEVGGMLGL